jgi:hypothetical protein
MVEDNVLYPLTLADRNLLRDLEASIEGAWYHAVNAGNALAKIRDMKLYKDKYNSFERYLKGRWRMSRAQAYRLIDLAEVARDVEDVEAPPTKRLNVEFTPPVPSTTTVHVNFTREVPGTTTVPFRQATGPTAVPPEDRQIAEKSTVTNESQARELKKVPPEDRRAVFAKAKAAAGGREPTGAQVAAAVAEHNGIAPKPPTPKQVTVDRDDLNTVAEALAEALDYDDGLLARLVDRLAAIRSRGRLPAPERPAQRKAK